MILQEENHNFLKANHIKKSYRGRQVVKGISLSLAPGEIVGVFGPNGAGKTTCFSMIAGLIKPESGEILLGKINITSLAIYLRARKGISYLPQEPSVFKTLTVEENIMAVLEVIYPGHDTRLQVLEQLLEEFSIGHLRRHKAGHLSGGERRRLEIARTIATNPKFILLDEPLASIDPVTIYEIKEIILKLKSRNIGVLITDHNIKDTLEIIDRGYIVYDGQILEKGTADEIVLNPQVRRLYLDKRFK